MPAVRETQQFRLAPGSVGKPKPAGDLTALDGRPETHGWFKHARIGSEYIRISVLDGHEFELDRVCGGDRRQDAGVMQDARDARTGQGSTIVADGCSGAKLR